ncbi:hypothetical protein OEZ49_11370 [Ruegeria sp. WL0004]|uniref:Uncharacterized protein n=1 Tax=Ruegeria marisflavi TaxID=2984152 RepID=A0ABT2WR30_9RHOB|nr:hypothetical protein [Ruegeria sp. WL0004]MCU9838368.1 hypothetical protein [Ruegeria sp. WL0004]
MKHLFLAAAPAFSTASGAWAEGKTHYLAVHVDENDPQVMNIALNDVANVTKH